MKSYASEVGSGPQTRVEVQLTPLAELQVRLAIERAPVRLLNRQQLRRFHRLLGVRLRQMDSQDGRWWTDVWRSQWL